jgi:hypothetical protein
MRKLGILSPSQEEQGIRLIEIAPKVYELRDSETLVVAYAGFVDRKQIIKDADEYLRRKHAGR